LENKDGCLDLPAASTIGDLLKREGLIHPRRRRTRPLDGGYCRPSGISQPNEEWRADFKGEFKMGNGEYCYPLTMTDGASRYLLETRALDSTAGAGARRCFERAFHLYGLPWSIRTDNGSPFASTAIGRLSSLSVWWIRLGIRPVRGRPKNPQDNGGHERMHRTLKAETTRPPSWGKRGQQGRFDRFRREFNEERPHEALSQKPPCSIYRPSERAYPRRLPDIEYPSHYEVRKVGSGGIFGWRSRIVFASQSLVGEHIGLVEVEDGLWKVWFANMELGVLDEVQLTKRKTGKVLPMSPV
jgi:transposase InsO family protein